MFYSNSSIYFSFGFLGGGRGGTNVHGRRYAADKHTAKY